MATVTEFRSAGSASTLVWTPRVMENPAPREPFSRGSSASSQIWKRPVRWPGAKAEASIMGRSIFSRLPSDKGYAASSPSAMDA